MNELSGGAPGEYPPRRIEAGPEQGGYSDGGDAKPWQRGPSADVAPWQQRGRENRRDDYGSRGGDYAAAPPPWAAPQSRGGDYAYGAQAGYAAPGTAPGAAPWQQPAPPGGQASYGYGGYGGYAYPPGMAAPPPPPGMPQMVYGSPPPPPPPGDQPPPPSSQRSASATPTSGVSFPVEKSRWMISFRSDTGGQLAFISVTWYFDSQWRLVFGNFFLCS